jgi:hypothetical protein
LSLRTPRRSEQQQRHRNRGDGATQNRNLARVQRLFRGFRDDVLESDAGDGNPQIQRQVPVTPDLEADGFTPRSNHVFPGRVHDVVIAPPDGHDQPHTEHRRDSSADAPVLLMLHPGHHGYHRFAHQDDGEEAVAFRQMRRVMRDIDHVCGRDEWCDDIDRECDGPQPESQGRRH